jgi:hypothetical protein
MSSACGAEPPEGDAGRKKLDWWMSGRFTGTNYLPKRSELLSTNCMQPGRFLSRWNVRRTWSKVRARASLLLFLLYSSCKITIPFRNLLFPGVCISANGGCLICFLDEIDAFKWTVQGLQFPGITILFLTVCGGWDLIMNCVWFYNFGTILASVLTFSGTLRRKYFG